MTRKKLITALSIFYILNGLWQIGMFFSPFTDGSNLVILDLTRLVGGALAVYVGLDLSRFNEFGRKLAIVFLGLRAAINTGILAWFVWSLVQADRIVGTGLQFLKKDIYLFTNPFASIAFLALWILIPVFTIVFLSQGETKKLFTPATSGTSNDFLELTSK